MYFRTTLLLLVGAASVLLNKVTRPGTDECFFVVNVPGKRMVSFANINWPDKYNNGEVCQWIFHCPSDAYCQLQCPDVGMPKTDDCYMDKLLVYSRGVPSIDTIKAPSKSSAHKHSNLKKHEDHARMYCGRTTINVKSNGTKIAMVLISNESSPGGRFRCTVTPHRWGHRAWRHEDEEPPKKSTYKYENSY